ncbi:MAG: hypothetical protein V1656_02870 [Candidatus Jorgensenbacteria bacterium]
MNTPEEIHVGFLKLFIYNQKKEDDHEIRTGIQRGYELGGCEEIYGRKEMGNALV